MKVTIVYDNTSIKNNFIPDWGFSALIEVGERKILFDTGANGNILLFNMAKLNIFIDEIEDVFISHYHWDHTGGLNAIISENKNIKLWLPYYMKFDEMHLKELVKIKDPIELYEGIYSTGTLDNIEQSLCLRTRKGIVIITGCSHPHIKKILDMASNFGIIYGIIGGLHANSPTFLKSLKFICATHCTYYKDRIKALYPDRYVEGGVGLTIEI